MFISNNNTIKSFNRTESKIKQIQTIKNKILTSFLHTDGREFHGNYQCVGKLDIRFDWIYVFQVLWLLTSYQNQLSLNVTNCEKCYILRGCYVKWLYSNVHFYDCTIFIKKYNLQQFSNLYFKTMNYSM